MERISATTVRRYLAIMAEAIAEMKAVPLDHQTDALRQATGRLVFVQADLLGRVVSDVEVEKLHPVMVGKVWSDAFAARGAGT